MRVTTLLRRSSPILIALCSCGSDPPAAESAADAGGEFKNACGGNTALVFLGRPASPTDSCGPCGTGTLVCAGAGALACVGSRDASCSEGGTSNGCGGEKPLVLDGRPATPGASCGPCGDGTTICTGPEVVVCIAATDASACRDGGSTEGGQSDATAADVARDDGGVVVDDARDDEADGADAREETAVDTDAARDQGADAPDVGAADASPDLGDVARPNACGGMGPLLWRGAPSAPNALCSDCGARLRCGSQTALVCNGLCPDAGPGEACEIPLAAYTASEPPRPAPPAEAQPTVTTAVSLTLAANGLVYNPFDSRLYASLGSRQGSSGNSIAVIDPATATVVKTTFIGSEPTQLALSDDGKALWVGLDGAGAVRFIDVDTGAPGQQFNLGNDPISGQWYPSSIDVLPGTRNSIIVTRYSKSSSATDGLVLYDNGVPRPYSVGYAARAQGALTTYSPALVFAYVPASSIGMNVACVNANGVFSKQDTVLGDTYGRFAFARNVIYSGAGSAYDIATANTLGKYGGNGAVIADAGRRRVYFLAGTQAPVVSAYDMDSFLPSGSETLAVTVSAGRANFVQWGRYGYAFTTGDQVVIVRTALFPAHP
jgi:hypothetical protein